MASYQIEWKRSARKELRKLPAQVIHHVVKKVESLASDPRPSGVRKLVGSEQLYRVRVGSYRIIYEIRDDVLIIVIVRVAHRKDVYR